MLTEEKYKQVMLEVIERYLGGKLSIRQFWKEFIKHYAISPDLGRLSDYDESFFDEVNERLHYADLESPAEPYLEDPHKFEQWLRTAISQYKEGEWKAPE
jgi:hypothetical protein